MNNKKTFSFTKGYSFIFEDDGSEIEAWFSSLTGLEKVYVDGELISKQRAFAKKSSSAFNIGATEYSTNIRTVSLVKGPVICTLSKNGKEFKRQKLSFPPVKIRPNKKPFYLMLIIGVILGALFGIASSYWQLPKIAFYIFAALGGLVIFSIRLRTYDATGPGPIIEDEEIL